jgi:hypothetical protein
MVLRHVRGVYHTTFTPRERTPPHSLPIQCITREYMMALHRAPSLMADTRQIPRPLDRGLPQPGDSSPSWDMYMPLRLPQHRGSKPPTEREKKARPLPTTRCLPHPKVSGCRYSGDFSSPTTSHRGHNGPSCKGNSSAGTRRPRLNDMGGSSSTLCPTGPHQQKLPSPLATL